MKSKFLKEVEVLGSHNFDIPIDNCVCRVQVVLVEPASIDELHLFGFNIVLQPLSGKSEASSSSVRLGDGCSSADIGLERCLKTMRVGETSLLRFAVDDEVEVPLSGAKELTLRVTLDALDQPSPAALWNMNSKELLAEAMHLKAKGVQLFGEKKPSWAFRLFGRAAKLLIAIPPTISTGSGTCDEAGDDQIRKMALVQCYANLAACQLQASNYEHAIVNCDKVLAVDANNVKCLYRRAVASMVLQRYDVAVADLDVLLKLEPSNTAAIRQKEVLRSKLNAREKSLGGALRNMFQ